MVGLFQQMQDMPLANYLTYLTFIRSFSNTQTITSQGNEDEEDLRRLMEGQSHHDGMMFQPLSCNADVTVDTCLGPNAVPFSTIVAAADTTPVDAILYPVMVATQSSTCWDGPASNAINGHHNDFTHTCANSDSPAWWMVDLGDDNNAVGEGMSIASAAHFEEVIFLSHDIRA